MASGDVDDYELEKIRAEIQQEKQMKEMLEQSARELRITVEELEKRYDSIENEEKKKLIAKLIQLLLKDSNEWKTRFETQEEMNQQLERQIIMLQDKVEEAKRNLKDAKAVVDGKTQGPDPESSRTDTPKSRSTGITINISVSPQGTPRCTVEAKSQGHTDEESAGKTPRDMKSFDDLSDANPAMVRSMEKEKQLLYNQLRDLEWRLDHESKAYHKANDERKQYVIEINAAKGNIEGNKARQRAAVTLQQHDADELSKSPRLMGYTDRQRNKVERKNSRNLKSDGSNPPSSQMSYTSPRSTNDTSYTDRHRQKVERRNSKNVKSDRSNPPSSQVSQTSPSTNDISNIPEDQRILDPRRGPIKKTAAVKTLPSLDTT